MSSLWTVSPYICHLPLGQPIFHGSQHWLFLEGDKICCKTEPLSPFFMQNFHSKCQKNLSLWQIFWHFIQRTLDCLVTLTHSQEMTVGCVYSPPNGTSVEWLQNAGQFVDGVSQLFCFRLRVSCKCFTCTLKYYTKAWKIRKWLLIKLTAVVCCLVSALCLAVVVTLHPPL